MHNEQQITIKTYYTLLVHAWETYFKYNLIYIYNSFVIT